MLVRVLLHDMGPYGSDVLGVFASSPDADGETLAAEAAERFARRQGWQYERDQDLEGQDIWRRVHASGRRLSECLRVKEFETNVLVKG